MYNVCVEDKAWYVEGVWGQTERKRDERESGRERSRYEEEKVLVTNGKAEPEEVKFARLHLDPKQF